ncbi:MULTISPECIES: oligopeptide ABC transporter permease OppB [Mesoplasma]|uniref:ABC transporter permease n=1 Tax=Mesoplasma florum TaxID=2151 RepID=A0A2R3P6V2_MESFO|nr:MULTISPECIES: oligopeptide ABC transporter permease OppB [Mesoplasma]AVN64230.1 ABC transporter permease [Mesoplasma florum]
MEKKEKLGIEELIESVSETVTSSKREKNIFVKSKFYMNNLLEIFYEFKKRYPLLFYSIKRIFFALITMYAAVIVIYCMISFIVKDETYLMDISGMFAKLGIQIGDDKYNTILGTRKKMLGVDGTLLHQILIYLRNITPFIPKTIQTNPTLTETGEIISTPVTKMFYLGLILSGNIKPVRTPVTEVFSSTMGVSFILGTVATILAYLIGIPLGIYAAIKKDKPQDSLINGISLVIIALPSLVLIKILYEISLKMGGSTQWQLGGIGTKMFPVIGLLLFITPGITITTRRFVVDEMTADYRKFALSKGLDEKYIFFVHVFRNAFIRMVRSIPAVFIASVFGSSLLIERTWNIQGMSNVVINAISASDIFLIMGVVVLSAFASIVSILAGDLLLAILDPRVKLS